MTYEESLDYLTNLCKFGINLGLARIEKLLELMEHPERKFKTIHITGTNGKGSTTAMLAAILQSSGLKTGMYTSPHLLDYTERIMVDGKPLSDEAFAKEIKYTSQFVEKIALEGLGHPTEFEVLTAAAFHHFACSGVEYAVVEVGLGGLLDSTNVIVPEVSVITNVTLDHIDKCGNSITEISTHKAGIIKPGVPVVTGATGEALDIIKKTAEEKPAQVFCYGESFSAEFIALVAHQQQIQFRDQEEGNSDTLTLNLVGYHQVDNSALAIKTALLLGKKEEKITLDSVKMGLGKVRWPGRFEVIPGKPMMIIDGAHNRDGARGLRKNLNEFYGQKEIIFLLGILQDKDAKGIISELIHLKDTVVVVAPLSERAGKPEEIAKLIEASHVAIADSIPEGLDKVRSLATENSVICVAGSLYLIGAVRGIICP